MKQLNHGAGTPDGADPGGVAGVEGGCPAGAEAGGKDDLGTPFFRGVWFANLGKRQVKTPKIYFRDSGILHHLPGIPDMAAMVVHPKLGVSWEGFALEQTIRLSGAEEEEVYFWGIRNQGELDLLLARNGKLRGFEVKYTDHPGVTASRRLALECLGLDRLDIICPGDASYPLDEKIHVTGLDRIAELFS